MGAIQVLKGVLCTLDGIQGTFNGAKDCERGVLHWTDPVDSVYVWAGQLFLSKYTKHLNNV